MTGPNGIEVTELLLEPDTEPTQGSSRVVDSDTIKLLQIDRIKTHIARKLDGYASQFRKQLDLDEEWATDPAASSFDRDLRTAMASVTKEWATVASDAAAGGIKSTRGRKPDPESKWVERAELALRFFSDGHGKVHARLAEAWFRSENTVKMRLSRMRRPPSHDDLGTGWLLGTRTGTRAGERLKSLRNTASQTDLHTFLPRPPNPPTADTRPGEES